MPQRRRLRANTQGWPPGPRPEAARPRIHRRRVGRAPAPGVQALDELEEACDLLAYRLAAVTSGVDVGSPDKVALPCLREHQLVRVLVGGRVDRVPHVVDHDDRALEPAPVVGHHGLGLCNRWGICRDAARPSQRGEVSLDIDTGRGVEIENPLLYHRRCLVEELRVVHPVIPERLTTGSGLDSATHLRRVGESELLTDRCDPPVRVHRRGRALEPDRGCSMAPASAIRALPSGVDIASVLSWPIAVFSAPELTTRPTGIGAAGFTSVFSTKSPLVRWLNVAISPAPPPDETTAPLKMSGRSSIAMRDANPPRELPIVSVRATGPNCAMNASRTVRKCVTAPAKL